MGGFGLFVFLVLPIAEIVVIIEVANAIGGFATALLLLGGSVIGGVIVRRVGSRAWRALRASAVEGRRAPHDVVDGAIVLLGGLLLLVPGFITDAVGILLLLPPTRRLSRWLVAGYLFRRVRAAREFARRTGRRSPYDPPGTIPGDIIEGEVVDDMPADQGGTVDPARKRDRPDQIGRAG
jgi:UPF0716 protein FxsA